ncbi:hypothetical protein [Methylobacterium sp. WCS2018Hpa-22]|uniref:hypothetical protein n=1 Tax=Methylobacterium sp. WCS2018Hpa-22 TaxID=3073633 RepID=UPI00288BE047|nr:hypothetical protein [Methylobacterium sp. WCS2018Hpa-22]
MTGIVVTVFVLAHERRGSLPAETAGLGLDSKVEIDGAHFGGSVRPENRKDHRLKANQSPERRVFIVLCQRTGRTVTFLTKPASWSKCTKP